MQTRYAQWRLVFFSLLSLFVSLFTTLTTFLPYIVCTMSVSNFLTMQYSPLRSFLDKFEPRTWRSGLCQSFGQRRRNRSTVVPLHTRPAMLTVHDLSLLLLSFDTPQILSLIGVSLDSPIHAYSTFIPPSSRSSAPPLRTLVLCVSEVNTKPLDTPAPIRVSGTLKKLPPSLKLHETFDIILVTSTSQMDTKATVTTSPSTVTISGKLKLKDLGSCDAWIVDAGTGEGWLVG